jgi:glycosyltransferase involved in cell wall biosynthesis
MANQHRIALFFYYPIFFHAGKDTKKIVTLSDYLNPYMKVSGFTFIRNAQKFDYPIVEAITSVLPLCDEMVVCVGHSDDNTLSLVESIPSDKIKIIPSVWDDSLRKGGRVLALETDKAFDAVAADSDWAFYIQGDEVLPEQYLPVVRRAMEAYRDNEKVEGLLFNYLHFYGNYQYVGISRMWYRHEIRVIRNNKAIRAYRDAQGFRIDGRKLRAKPIDACIYHYGWVRSPYHQKAKTDHFATLYREKVTVSADELYDYSKVCALQLFEGTHPKVMQERIVHRDWDFTFDVNKKNLSFKEKLLLVLEKITGRRWFEYKNYKII